MPPLVYFGAIAQLHLVHLVALEHLYAHDVNLALVGVHVRAHFDVMAIVSLQGFRVRYIP